MVKLPDIKSYIRSLDLPIFGNKENEELALQPKESDILNIPIGTMGWDIIRNVYFALKAYNILPRIHAITSDDDDFPTDIGVTPVDNKGLGKRKQKGEAIIKANHPKMVGHLQKYSEIFGIQTGGEPGGTFSNNEIVADANKACGRSTLTIASLREIEPTSSELQNLKLNVQAFKAVRDEWGGGMMLVIKPEPAYSLARNHIANHIFTMNLSCAQGVSNPNDFCAMVDEHAFGLHVSCRVLTEKNVNPSQLYEIMKNRVKTLMKRGYLEKCSTDLYSYFFGPTDILEDKETLTGFVRLAFVDAGIDVNDRVFEPVIAYNHFLNNRNLWVHGIVPIDIDACLKRIVNSHGIRSEEK